MKSLAGFTLVACFLFLLGTGIWGVAPEGAHNTYGPHPTLGFAALILASFAIAAIIDENN